MNTTTAAPCHRVLPHSSPLRLRARSVSECAQCCLADVLACTDDRRHIRHHTAAVVLPPRTLLLLTYTRCAVCVCVVRMFFLGVQIVHVTNYFQSNHELFLYASD